MIRLRDIRYRYPGTHDEWVLKNIDLCIEEGEYVFLCGASGSGKSSLAYLFNGLIPQFFGGTLEGSVTLNGENIREKKVSELLSHVGLVFQNADGQLFNSTVENEIAFGLESLGLPARQIERRIRSIAERLNLEDLLHRSPMALSGGEKRLVAIASVLCLNPPVLLLDEPYAHIDWEGARRVRQALWEIHQSGKTVVVIEHRLGGFLNDATRCLVMDRGLLIFDGRPEEAQAVLRREQLVPNYPSRPIRREPSEQILLAAHDISFRLAKREILTSVSVELKKGETVAIVGRNGSGKTTLIKHFNGLLRPNRGELTFTGRAIRGKAPSEMATSVGLSFQNPNDQFFKYRVLDELLVGPRILGRRRGAWFHEVCDLFDLHHLLERSPYRLSEGEKKRVALASILAMRPQLLVLDEPTVGQDGRFREALAGLLAALDERGLTTLIVTHDLEFAQAAADRWIVLHEGKVVGDGRPERLARDEQLARLGALCEPGQEAMWALSET